MSECQLTNEELIKKVRMWVDELCRTGGKGWSLQVPVNMERDPDVLISELCDRFESSLQAVRPDEEDGLWAEGFAERCGEKAPAKCKHPKIQSISTKRGHLEELHHVCLICGAIKNLENGVWSAPTMEPVPAPPNCLQEADKIINGERQDMYGSPEDSFEIIAGYWNVFLREKIREACHKKGMDKVDIANLLSPLDTTNMMILFKQARKLGQKPCRDNYVDSCGYEGIGADRLMKEADNG